MSDRRRNPKQDDWDDDLDLAGWEPPTSRKRPAQQPPRNPSQPRPDPYASDFENPSVDPYDPYQPPPARQTQQPRERRGSDPSRGQYPDQRPPSSQPYRAPASSSRGTPPAPSDYDEFAMQPTRQSAASAPSTRQRYPPAPADFEPEGYAAPPARRRRTRSQDARRTRPGVSVPRPAINDGTVIGIATISLLSLVFMAATVAAGAGDLPEWFPIHLDASGDADSWGTSDVLWRIPFGVLMTVAMSVVIAVILWKRDRFAARMAMAGTALAQVLAWVALADFIW